MQVLVWKSSITFLPKPVVPSHVSWLCSPAESGGLEREGSVIPSCIPQHSFFLKYPAKFLSLGQEIYSNNLINSDKAERPQNQQKHINRNTGKMQRAA